MEVVLRKVREALSQDAVIAASVATYGVGARAAPAVFVNVVPHDAQMRYVVITPTQVTAQDDGGVVCRAIIALDVWDAAEKGEQALAVAGRAQQVLVSSGGLLLGDGRGRAWFDYESGPMLVPEEGVDIQHAQAGVLA